MANEILVLSVAHTYSFLENNKPATVEIHRRFKIRYQEQKCMLDLDKFITINSKSRQMQ